MLEHLDEDQSMEHINNDTKVRKCWEGLKQTPCTVLVGTQMNTAKWKTI